MRSFTVAAVLTLLASVVAGAPLDVVDTLRGDVSVPGPRRSAPSATPQEDRAAGNVKEHIPRFGSLVVDGKYYVAIGEEFKQDKRDSASAYVCGIEDSNDAAEIRFELQPFFSDPDIYRLSVAGNSMSDRAVDWYFGAHRYYPSDSFGDDQHSLRVIAHRDRSKGAIWIFEENPHKPGSMMLELEYSFDDTTPDVTGWYLALSDSPDAERDSTSTYLTVTDDPSKAAAVEIMS